MGNLEEMELKRDNLGRFVKGTIPPYADKPMPDEVRQKLRVKALTPERIEKSLANLQPDRINVVKRPDIREKIADAHRGHPASLEIRQKMSAIHKERQKDPDLRQRTSNTLKQFCEDPAVREGKAEASLGRIQSPSEKAKKSKAITRSWQDTEVRTKISNSIREAYTKPEVKERQKSGVHKRWGKTNERYKQSLLSKQLWQNPEYIRKVIKGIGRRPTKPERTIDSILNEHFPEFRYNGDYSLGIMVAGFMPDFVNINGKKEIIEVFGDYHHSPEIIEGDWRRSELGKIMAYNSVGWNCLIIWEHEIKNLTKEELTTKIETFFGKRRR